MFPTARIAGESAGTPQERAADLITAFKDPKVKAIICNIGGLSANEILDLLDYKTIKNNPKIFCGYRRLHFYLSQSFSFVCFENYDTS